MRTPPALFGSQFEVRGGGLAEIAQGDVGLAQPRGDERMHARAQRTAVGAARLVVAEVRFRRRAGKLVRQQRHQHHHVGLLDHLRALRPLAAEHHVHRHLAVGVERDRWLQPVEAGELLDRAR